MPGSLSTIASLLPAGTAAAEAFADRPGEQPFPGEEDLLASAVEGRRRELVTARRCAREALARLGIAPVAIGRGPRREPIWPAGVVGSITHCTGYRAAVVARQTTLASIGIDAEPHGPLPAGVREMVTDADEGRMLDRLAAEEPAVAWGRLLFSAKESVYKAWFPLTGRWLDFTGARLEVSPADRTFTATLLVDGRLANGGEPLTHFHGRYLITADHVVTAVAVPLAAAGSRSTGW